MACLRVADFDNEIAMWSRAFPDPTPADEVERRVAQGPAPLLPGDASFLSRADLGVELAAKARALHDIWSPWLEGLAVFAETSADPTSDPARINPVTRALRGMLDFALPTRVDAAEQRRRYELLVATQDVAQANGAALS